MNSHSETLKHFAGWTWNTIDQLDDHEIILYDEDDNEGRCITVFTEDIMSHDEDKPAPDNYIGISEKEYTREHFRRLTAKHYGRCERRLYAGTELIATLKPNQTIKENTIL